MPVSNLKLITELWINQDKGLLRKYNSAGGGKLLSTLAMRQKPNKKKTKVTRKKLIEQYTYDMYLLSFREGFKRQHMEGKSYSCCVRMANITVFLQNSDTLRWGTVKSFLILGLNETYSMNFMQLQTVQLKENWGVPCCRSPPRRTLWLCPSA